MYYIQNKITGQPMFLHQGKVQKAYYTRVVANSQLAKVEDNLSIRRYDVVEISKSARLYLENQNRLWQ